MAASTGISRIDVQHGGVIDNLKFSYWVNGQEYSPGGHGGAGGALTSIVFAPGERLLAITGLWGDTATNYGTHVSHVTFTTNFATYGPFGDPQLINDTPFTISSPGMEIMAIHGYSGTFLNALGGDFAPSSVNGTTGSTGSTGVSSSTTSSTGSTGSTSSTGTSSSSTGSTGTTTGSTTGSVDAGPAPFFASGAALPHARAFASSVVYGGSVYVLGGLNGGIQNLWPIPPAYSDALAGSVGDVESTSSTVLASVGSLTKTRFAHASIVIDQRIYTIGGVTPDVDPNNRFVQSDEIEYAPGGDFTSSTLDAVHLQVPRAWHGVALGQQPGASRVLYVAGGLHGTDLRSVELSTVDSSGELQGFTLWSEQLFKGRSAPVAGVWGDCLFVVGGNGSDSAAPGTYDAFALDAAGTSFTAHQLGTLQNPRTGAMGALVGGHLYLAGGSPSYDTYVPLDSVDDYLVDSSTCSLTYLGQPAQLTVARWSAAGAWLESAGQATLFAFGGETGANGQYHLLASGEWRPLP